MGIIRAATGIKEMNVITATSAGEVVLLLLLFITYKLKSFCLGILSCSRSCAELSSPQVKAGLGLAGQHYRLTCQERSCSWAAVLVLEPRLGGTLWKAALQMLWPGFGKCWDGLGLAVRTWDWCGLMCKCLLWVFLGFWLCFHCLVSNLVLKDCMNGFVCVFKLVQYLKWLQGNLQKNLILLLCK